MPKDFVGQKYGRLVILSKPERVGKTSNYMMKCLCDCGVIRDFRRGDVVSGKSKSCGCLNQDTLVERITTHGKSKTFEYRCWFEMEARCRYKNREGYEYYGAKGITVDPTWRGSEGFSNFLTHIGLAPSSDHQVDRIDPLRGYLPGNVRWATRKEQARNKTNNRFITVFGQTKCLSEWAEEYGINRNTLISRLKTQPPEQALTKPVRKLRR